MNDQGPGWDKKKGGGRATNLYYRWLGEREQGTASRTGSENNFPIENMERMPLRKKKEKNRGKRSD